MNRTELVRHHAAITRIEQLLNMVPKDGKYTKLWINAEDVDVFLAAVEDYKKKVAWYLAEKKMQDLSYIVLMGKAEEIKQEDTSGYREALGKTLKELSETINNILGTKKGENNERGTGSTDT